jgi:penicillin-binding protein 1A
VLYDHGFEKRADVQVIGSPALEYMNQMLRQVVLSGTGTGARVAGYDIAGKTGTTSDYRDAWFVGYTGGFVTVVWVGRDNNKPMARVTGGGTPAGIWKDFMGQALPRLKTQNIPGQELPEPDGFFGDAISDLLSGLGIGRQDNDSVAPEPQPTPPPELPY